jgi:hypothetical protein
MGKIPVQGDELMMEVVSRCPPEPKSLQLQHRRNFDAEDCDYDFDYG